MQPDNHLLIFGLWPSAKRRLDLPFAELPAFGGLPFAGMNS